MKKSNMAPPKVNNSNDNEVFEIPKRITPDNKSNQ
jgi:hypothetical protein